MANETDPQKPTLEIVKRSDCVHIEIHFPDGSRFKITNRYGSKEITVNLYDGTICIVPSVSNEIRIKPAQ